MKRKPQHFGSVEYSTLPTSEVNNSLGREDRRLNNDRPQPRQVGCMGQLKQKAYKKWTRLVLSYKGLLSSKQVLFQFLQQTWKEICLHKVNFALGFMACFLVVMVVSLMLTILANSPVIFLRLAEATKGEVDLEISPGDWTGLAHLNYTLVSQILAKDSRQSYHTPRYIGEVYLVASSSCRSGLDPNDPTWKYLGDNSTFICPPFQCKQSGDGDNSPSPDPTKAYCWQSHYAGKCFEDMCGTSSYKAQLYLIDTQKEKRMEIGREWKLGDIKEGHAFMITDIAKRMKVNKGDTIYMAIGMDHYFPGLYQEINLPYVKEQERQNRSDDYDWAFYEAYTSVIIQELYSDPDGKHPIDQENVIMMEYSTFLRYMAKNLHPKMPQELRDRWASANLYDYAGHVAINFPPPRIQTYLKSDYDKIEREVVQFSSKIAYDIGFNEIDVTMPVIDSLKTSQYFSLFLGLILNVVILILLLLSIMLIYSLLMVNVETRTFEMGVLRLVGTTRGGIIHLLLMQAFSYAVPSWVTGLIFSQCAMLGVSIWFKDQTGVPMEPYLTPIAIMAASLLGLLVPIASAIFPIRHALGQNLHDSLDTKRQKVQAVSVDLERSEDRSFSWSLLVIGISLTIFGFAVYYVMPLSLLTMDLTLLLNIFFFILISMLLGLVLLSLNIEPLLERIIIAIFLFFERSPIRNMVHKNLVAHRKRNRKTTIMYALSLGFIIFIMVSYSNVLDGFAYRKDQRGGAYLKIIAEGIDDLQQNQYKEFRHSIHVLQRLEDFIRNRSDAIVRHSFITHKYNDVWKTHAGPDVLNLGRTFKDNLGLYAIAPNFLETVFSGFLILEEGKEYDEGMSLAEQLYTVAGSSRAWMGTTYRSYLGLKGTNSEMLWSFAGKQGTDEARDTTNDSPSDGGGSPNNEANPNEPKPAASYESRVVLRPLAFFDAAPIFSFSKFRSWHQDTVVSLPTYLRFVQGIGEGIYSVEDLPYSELLLQVSGDYTQKGPKRDELKSQLYELIKDQAGLRVWDYYGSSNPIEKADKILTAFFMFTTVVAMLIASFSLVSSMYTNIYEQTKEIGIVRAIGMRRAWLRRIYIYEAFVLVLASSLLGVIIGSAVGYTMLLQRILFTQLPLPFRFPWQILIVVFIFSMVFALASSLGPITSVMKKSIVHILRF